MVALASSWPPRLLNWQRVPNPQRLRVPIVRVGAWSPANISDRILAEPTGTHYWKFNETSGDFADSKGSITLTSAADGSHIMTYAVAGASGNAIQIGTDGLCYNITTATLDLSSPFTIYMVARIDANETDAPIVMEFNGAGGATFRIRVNNAGTLKVVYTPDGSTFQINDVVTGTSADSTWRDFAFVYTGSHFLVYRNGDSTPVLDVTVTLTSFVITQSVFFRDVGGGTSAYGRYQHIATFSSALPTATLAAFHSLAGFADTTPPVAASATVAADGGSIAVACTEVGSVPILPSSGITGFTLSVGGSTVAISSATAAGTTITLIPARTIRAMEHVTLSYSGGNVTDSATIPNSLTTFTNLLVTNSSAVAATTDAVIVEMAVSAAKMGPFVWQGHAAFSTVAVGRLDEANIVWSCSTATAIAILDPRYSTSTSWDYRSKQRNFAAAFLLPAGTHTITCTVTARDGSSDNSTVDVTVVADTRTDWYVSSTGNNSNTGLSDGQAWLTVAKAITELNLSPTNKRINIKGGATYDETALIEPVGSTNCIIQSYGTGTATLRYTGVTGAIGFVHLGANTANYNFIVQNLNFTSNQAAWNDSLVPDATGGDDITAFYGATPPTIEGAILETGNSNAAFINVSYTSRFRSIIDNIGMSGLFVAAITTDHSYRQGFVSFNAQEHAVMLGGVWKRSSQEHIVRLQTTHAYVAIAACSFDCGLVAGETTPGNTKGVRYQSVYYGSFYDNEADDVGYNLSYDLGDAHDLIWRGNHMYATTQAIGIGLVRGVQNVTISRNIIDGGAFTGELITPVEKDDPTYQSSLDTKNVSIIKNTIISPSPPSSGWVIDTVYDAGGFFFSISGLRIDGNLFVFPSKAHTGILRVHATTDIDHWDQNVLPAFAGGSTPYEILASHGATPTDVTVPIWLATYGFGTNDEAEDVPESQVDTYPYRPATSNVLTVAVGLVGGAYTDFFGGADGSMAGAVTSSSISAKGQFRRHQTVIWDDKLSPRQMRILGTR